jgi:archaeosine synthase beta-subunit
MIISLLSRGVKVAESFGLGRKFMDFTLSREEFFFTDLVYNPLAGETQKRLVVDLPGRGCSWHKISGGCTMCGFNEKLRKVNREWNFSSTDLVKLFEMAVLLSQKEKPKIVCIYNGGSFLNETEIPLLTQLAIAELTEKDANIETLFIESRPEFITLERLRRLTNILGQKKLEVGIGLEAVTDEVREVYINKGFGLADYETAVKNLKESGVYLLTYAFLKPLGLSEREAIEEAVKTIEYSLAAGSDEVSLSSAFVQKGTKMAKAYERGEFKPPRLWSIVEVIERTAHLGPVKVGSFKDDPPPIAVPYNCEFCSQKVEKALEEYNFGRDKDIFHELDCECR